MSNTQIHTEPTISRRSVPVGILSVALGVVAITLIVFAMLVIGGAMLLVLGTLISVIGVVVAMVTITKQVGRKGPFLVAPCLVPPAAAATGDHAADWLSYPADPAERPSRSRPGDTVPAGKTAMCSSRLPPEP